MTPSAYSQIRQSKSFDHTDGNNDFNIRDKFVNLASALQVPQLAEACIQTSDDAEEEAVVEEGGKIPLVTSSVTSLMKFPSQITS